MFFKLLGSRAGYSAVRSAHLTSTFCNMPLRAKVMGQTASYSQKYKNIDMDILDDFSTSIEKDPEDVIFNSIYGLRTIELNRPQKLNALGANMINKILPRMVEWERSDMANVVVLKGSGNAFCSGGDVRTMVEQLQTGSKQSVELAINFFRKEYQLDHYIATYQKPMVSFMDGITMGGGVGLSVHSPLRIATERTIFAMPETKIGLFPDVGASFFLPRMNGAIGTYLALTSESLQGANVFYSGIATHYLDSTMLPSLEARLAELRFKDYDSLATRLSLISRTIDEFSTGLPHGDFVLSGELRNAIDRCFSRNSIAEIIAALINETGPTQDWAQSTLRSLYERSPTSVHVALRQMRISKGWSIAETFQREHAMASKFVQSHDFVEGVDALLISKRTPVWKPESLEAIAESKEDVSSKYFMTTDKKIPLLTARDYHEYPHANLGVPTEKEVRELIETTDLTIDEVINTLFKSRNRRQGIKAVLKDIIARRVISDDHNRAQWVEP
ncbi:3-hydroxyisobutyryl-CoA hydrolase [Ceratocystis pirilliformis]|uniref:3-hydroxyisobutyryl-CoA hydrolase n=1 Tax=Ceratocystis pirilliformis TaxID=259994 RepID=A0ABR3YYE7_9PEZI